MSAYAPDPPYPAFIVPVNHVEPVPRRIRAYVGATLVLDTSHARYVWEHPRYPQYYVPIADFTEGVLIGTGHEHPSRRGPVEACDLLVDGEQRPHAGARQTDDTIPGLADTVHLKWDAVDRWFEEDEQVFVHPRSPYGRVDALRSSQTVRVEVDGTVLAESSSPVIVFETGLPPRYYLPRTHVDFAHLSPSDTVTSCPYKGDTSEYWTARIGATEIADVAWAYDFPTAPLLPIAGLVSFYNEKVDTFLDGTLVARPATPFS